LRGGTMVARKAYKGVGNLSVASDMTEVDVGI
jgi:hypothetical protein